jgi:hypothetical protein
MNKTDKLIREIARLNKHKDESLASKLHELAGKYQRRPQEGWRPPEDWQCWKDAAERSSRALKNSQEDPSMKPALEGMPSVLAKAIKNLTEVEALLEAVKCLRAEELPRSFFERGEIDEARHRLRKAIAVALSDEGIAKAVAKHLDVQTTFVEAFTKGARS